MDIILQEPNTSNTEIVTKTLIHNVLKHFPIRLRETHWDKLIDFIIILGGQIWPMEVVVKDLHIGCMELSIDSQY